MRVPRPPVLDEMDELELRRTRVGQLKLLPPLLEGRLRPPSNEWREGDSRAEVGETGVVGDGGGANKAQLFKSNSWSRMTEPELVKLG